jgi:hypothetical protein
VMYVNEIDAAIVVSMLVFEAFSSNSATPSATWCDYAGHRTWETACFSDQNANLCLRSYRI